MSGVKSASPAGRSIDPRIRQRRISVQRREGRRRLHRVVAGLVVVLVVVLAWFALHTPLFSARVISVTGPHAHTSRAAIVDASGLDGHPALVGLDAGAVARQVESLPFVASARVERHWPDGVQIAVTERVPVVEMAGPGHGYSVLDGRGRTLQVAPSHVPDIKTLVVHTSKGALAPAPVGRVLTGPAVAAGLRVARTLPAAFVGQVDLVSVATDGTVSLLLSSGITVLLGGTDELTAKYEDAAAIIAHGALHSTSVIDVSVPESPTVGG